MTILPTKRAVNGNNNEESGENNSQSTNKERPNRHRDDLNGNNIDATASTSRLSYSFDGHNTDRKSLKQRYKESPIDNHRERRERERQKHREIRRERKRDRHAKRSTITENTNDDESGSNVCEEVDAGPSNVAAEKNDILFINEDGSGCNSEDEYDPRRRITSSFPTAEEWARRDAFFSRCLMKLGYEIKQMNEDGACLFRAIADQVYGDQELHSTVRSQCMDYIVKNQDFFAPYVTEDFDKYVERKRGWYVHGNHLEIQALSEMYNRTIEVYCYHTEPINIFNANSINSYEPIRVSYHRMCHYNSITNPKKPSVLVGLGLPNYCTRCDLDRRDIHDAVRQSEELLIEQTMLEDKIKATDWEATSEAIEEEVARQSYIQFYQDAERRLKKTHSSATAAAGSSSTITSGMCSSPRSSRRGSVSPKGSMSPKGDASPKLYLTQASSPRQTSFPPETSTALLPFEKSEHVTYSQQISAVEFGNEDAETAYQSYPMDTQNSENVNEAGMSNSQNSTLNDPNNYESEDYDDWNESIMAQILAESQLTYFEDLKRKVKKRNGSPEPSTSQL